MTVVDPGDANPSPLCPHRRNNDDDGKREKLFDAILTTPPLTEWPPDCRDQLQDTCKYVISLGRLSRALRQMGLD